MIPSAGVRGRKHSHRYYRMTFGFALLGWDMQILSANFPLLLQKTLPGSHIKVDNTYRI